MAPTLHRPCCSPFDRILAGCFFRRVGTQAAQERNSKAATRLASSSVFFIAILCSISSPAFDLLEYLPPGTKYVDAIPTPEQFFGFEIGQRHLQYHELVGYLTRLADLSKRAVIEQYAHSHGGRPLTMMIITSPTNHARIEAIRAEHLRLIDPSVSEEMDLSDLPAVVNMGYSVHGDEASASNCVPIIAYHLLAARGPKIRKLLENTIILLDPCLNPDGFERFANWANNHRGQVLNADRNHREHQQGWPTGRTNYYWFDLNRDWLPAQHPESRGRLAQYHQWMPNVLLDFHEMGTDSTYFFQPGISARNHPLIPRRTYELTDEISRYHARALDEIGSLYFTRENFDDFYLGKGSSYPDLHGGVGILFEQASSRGLVQESARGDVTFPFTIRNQVRTTLSSLEATLDKRLDLLENMRSFYRESVQASKQAPIQSYLFTAPGDPARLFEFSQLLSQHHIEAYWLKHDFSAQKQAFKASESIFVPAQQREHLFVKALFDRPTSFSENIFYDTSAWTLPGAFNLRYAELAEPLSSDLLGPSITAKSFPAQPFRSNATDLAYVVDYRGYYAPRTLARLLSAGVRVQVATQPLQLSEQAETWPTGSLVVYVGNQPESRGSIASILNEAAEKDALRIAATETGLTPQGVDLGSNALHQLQMPKILLAIGSGVTASEAGEIWHLLDHRFRIPVTLVDVERFGSLNLEEYTHVILPSGTYSSLGDSAATKFQSWMRSGGTMVAMGSAIRFLETHKLAAIRFRPAANSGLTSKAVPMRKPFAQAETNADLQLISGAIFEVEVDTTHPLAYGLTDDRLCVFRDQRIFLEPSPNPYSTPAIYPGIDAKSGQIAGYTSNENLQRLSKTASVLVQQVGSGRIIMMVDNPNFRAYWYGSNRLFLNALFMSQLANEPAGE